MFFRKSSSFFFLGFMVDNPNVVHYRHPLVNMTITLIFAFFCGPTNVSITQEVLFFLRFLISHPSSGCSLGEISYILPPTVWECKKQIERTISQVILIKVTDLRNNLSALRSKAMCPLFFFTALLFATFIDVGKKCCAHNLSSVIKFKLQIYSIIHIVF